MNLLSIRLLILFFLLPVVVHGENLKRVSYSQLALDLFGPENKVLEYKNTEFYNDLPDEGKEYFMSDSWRPEKVGFILGGFRAFLLSKGILPGKDGFYAVTNSIHFEQCRFEDDLRFVHCRFEAPLELIDVDFPKASEDGVGIEENQGGALLLDSCEFGSAFLFDCKSKNLIFPRLRSCRFEYVFMLLGQAVLRVKKCSFDLSSFWLQSHHDKTSVTIDSCDFQAKSNDSFGPSLTELAVNFFSFRNNRIADHSKRINTFVCPSANIDLSHNQFDANVKLVLSSAYFSHEPTINLESNVFKKQLILKLESIGLASKLDPKELNNLNFGIDWNGFYNATGSVQIENQRAFRIYQKTNKLLFDFFRSTGDLGSSNETYVHMMKAEGRKLTFEYQQNPSFQRYFRYRLNSLLYHYTRYGTDPARSIVVSLYVILLFAFFYFFFPSNWEVQSKARLFQDFQDFIEKNDKGYAKPFLKLLKGFGVSMFNAIILSLNAFTTLGFGEIPTTGIARYVCVIQGFIGWFLLSIFTVALFNQAQF